MSEQPEPFGVYTLRLPHHLREAIRQRAAAEDRSSAYIVRRELEKLVDSSWSPAAANARPRGQEAPMSRQDRGPGAPARRGADKITDEGADVPSLRFRFRCCHRDA
jgi:hypothetical protein